MPVDRPWGELLVHADDSLTQYLAVMANIDSLHRLTRENSDLRDLVTPGSDHLTGYNVFAEAVNECGAIGSVYGLERHEFDESISEWAESRGVLVKGIEDIALGMASIMRTLERRLPEKLPRTSPQIVRDFRDLLAKVMPFDLVLDGETANGQSVRVSKSSVCSAFSAVAGRLSYFAGRFGAPRAAIEGTSIPLKLIQRYASRGEPEIELRNRRGRPRLSLVRASRYAGFVLDRQRTAIVEAFPEGLEDAARLELAHKFVEGITTHSSQESVSKVVQRLDDYWRRSGGDLAAAHPQQIEAKILAQLQEVFSWQDFLDTAIHLSIDDFLSSGQRAPLDSLPTTATVRGSRIPLRYELDGATPVVRLRFREALARRVLERDLPTLDRPLRFSVIRGKRDVTQAASVEELQQLLRRIPVERRGHRRRSRR